MSRNARKQALQGTMVCPFEHIAEYPHDPHVEPVDLPSENQEEAVCRLPLTKDVAACGSTGGDTTVISPDTRSLLESKHVQNSSILIPESGCPICSHALYNKLEIFLRVMGNQLLNR